MWPTTLFRSGRRQSEPVVGTIVAMIFFTSGCAHIPGNYPSNELRPATVAALFQGEGFLLQAGSRLPVEQVEAELGQLKSQGFSRRDPQIISSVAKRKKVPPGLLADQSGCGFYRFTACLDPGTSLTLKPGALVVTVETNGQNLAVHDQGYLLVDRRLPGGCRPPFGSRLTLRAPEMEASVSCDFLVRLPVRGKIVALEVVPLRCDVVHTPVVW